MATLLSHIAHIISSFYHTLLELHAIPDFCLSRKKNKKTGKVYLYKQESTRNGRKQTKIKAAEEADYLSLYEKRQKLKARLRELKAQYKTLSFKDRRDVRYALACFRYAKDANIGEIIEKNTYLDGTARDSKSEIILSLLFELLGISYTHNYSIYAPVSYTHLQYGLIREDRGSVSQTIWFQRICIGGAYPSGSGRVLVPDRSRKRRRKSGDCAHLYLCLRSDSPADAWLRG